MRITKEKLIINSANSISWEDIETMRMSNEKLALVLKNGQVIELSNLGPWTVDTAFRTYEKYLHDHPEKIEKPRKKRKRSK